MPTTAAVHDRHVHPMISVVIPTKNAAAFLESCLRALRGQNLPATDFEIIVVDNFSADDTARIAERFGVKFHHHGPERSAQRNFGATQARGDLLLFLDVDMSLEPAGLEACIAALRPPDVVACFIPERIKGTGFWIRVRDFERSFYDATVIDAVRCIRRQAFLDAGGYDTSMSGPEDWDLDRRLAGRGRFVTAQTHVEHDESGFTLRRYLAKKRYYAADFSKYIAKWGRDAVTRKQLGMWYRYFGVFVEHGKWRKLVAHPLLALGMYGLRFLVGVVFLWSRFSKAR